MEGSNTKKLVKLLIFIFVICLCGYLSQVYQIDLDQIRGQLSQYPIGISGLLFVLLYVGLTTVFWYGPKDVFRVAAGIIFGAYISFTFIWIAEFFNIIIMFHLSRYLGRDYVEQRLGKKASDLDRIPKSRSRFGVFLWKVNMLVPTRFTDLGYGLTNIKFGVYFVPALLANIPRIFWQQYIFAGVGEAFITDYPESVTNFMLEDKFFTLCTICYILLIFIITIVYGIKKFQKLRNRT